MPHVNDSTYWYTLYIYACKHENLWGRNWREVKRFYIVTYRRNDSWSTGGIKIGIWQEVTYTEIIVKYQKYKHESNHALNYKQENMFRYKNSCY